MQIILIAVQLINHFTATLSFLKTFKKHFCFFPFLCVPCLAAEAKSQ